MSDKPRDFLYYLKTASERAPEYHPDDLAKRRFQFSLEQQLRARLQGVSPPPLSKIALWYLLKLGVKIGLLPRRGYRIADDQLFVPGAGILQCSLPENPKPETSCSSPSVSVKNPDIIITAGAKSDSFSSQYPWVEFFNSLWRSKK